MEITGKCYCGDITYKASGEPLVKIQCHCRECQYIAGGSANVSVAMPVSGFAYTSGEPRQFAREDLKSPVVREFCGKCGTSLLSRPPALPHAVMLKVGTLDDPEMFEKAQMAIFTAEKQAFHTIPEGVPAFEKLPG